MLRFTKVILLGILALAVNAGAVGLMPTPILKNAQISGDASFDQNSGKYTFTYTVTNPAGNTGEIWDFTIDVSAVYGSMNNQNYGLTIPLGPNQVDYNEIYSSLASVNATRDIPMPLQVIPFGQVVPAGWNGGLGIDSVAHFVSGDDTPNILPGTSLGGFQLISYGVPTIRNADIMPFWMHIVDDHDTVSDADMIAAGKIEQDIVFHTVSLGPSSVGPGSFAHWNQLRDDLVRAAQLGWISNKTLATTLTNQLAAARVPLDAKDYYTAKTLLQPMLDTISKSNPSQRTSEGYALVYLNVQSLINNTPNNEIEPKVTLTPKRSLDSLNSNQRLSVRVIDLANGSVPMSGITVRIRVDSGPNAGSDLGKAQTDLQGVATFAYTSAHVGTDGIVASALLYGGEVTYEDKGSVTWSGGANLIVPFFTPPLLITKSGNKFYMNEETQNIGNVEAPPSVTRYYISALPILDLSNAVAIGERSIPALKPGKSNSIKNMVFYMPTGLPAGTYFLAACADANSTVAELDESDNCSFSKIKGHQSIIVPVEKINGGGGSDGRDNGEDNDEGGGCDDKKDNDKNHRDDRDSSEGSKSWILGAPFGKTKISH